MRKGENVLIIIQDSELMLDLFSFNAIKLTFAPALNVKRINNAGQLENFDLSGSWVLKKNSYFKSTVYRGTAEVLIKFGIC